MMKIKKVAEQNLIEIVFYANALLRIFMGPLTIALAAFYLTKEEMGFYYGFISTLSAQQLMEMGLGYNLTRRISKNGRFNGGETRDKIELNPNDMGYVGLALTWHLMVGIFILFIIGPIGFLSFSTLQGTEADWELAWIFSVIASATLVATNPLPIIVEASGERLYVAKMRFFAMVASIAGYYVCMISGHGLAALGTTACITCLIQYSTCKKKLYINYSLMLKFLKNIGILREYFHDNWRISVVWGTGFFYWSGISLTILHVYGLEIAGLYGFSLAVLMAISSLSISRFKSKISLYSNKLTYESKLEVARSFKKDMLIYFLLYVFGVVIFSLIINLDRFSVIQDRLLEKDVFTCLIVVVLLSQLTSATGDFSRLTGGEPFFTLSLIANILLPISVLFHSVVFVDFKETMFVYVFFQIALMAYSLFLYKKLFGTKFEGRN